LKMALEALANGKKVREGEGGTKSQPALEDAAISAIEEALAQPKQEPWCMTMNGCKTKCEDCPDTITAIKEALEECPDTITAIKEALAQPVAFQNKSLYSELISAEDWENIDPVWYWMYRPLYTSPPKPEWVGLTDEQIRLDAHNADSGDWNDDRYQKFWHEGFKEGARGAESMLKESNTG
jgi:hypothetical protein